jgi:hypothetical protein
MSSLGHHPDWDYLLIPTPTISTLNMSKTGKKSKYPLKIRYNKKSSTKKIKKKILNTVGVLRSVSNLQDK